MNKDKSVKYINCDPKLLKLINGGTVNTVNSDNKRKSKNNGNTLNDPVMFMTMDEIKKKVENFELVSKTDIKDLNIGTTIIYFEKIFDKKTDSVKFKYKPGGRIIVNKKEYLVVTNGKTNWSVQLKNHIIFKMMPVINIQKKFDIQIEKLKLLIKEERKNYKKELSNYEKKLSDKDIIIKKLKYKLKKYQ